VTKDSFIPLLATRAADGSAKETIRTAKVREYAYIPRFFWLCPTARGAPPDG
jgi:hypothetical protein